MTFVLFYHSLVSDWNHGNAHFLRGVASELIARGHTVAIYEPQNGWSRTNLLTERGQVAVDEFARAYPELESHCYQLESLDLDQVLQDVDVVLVHEWNDAELVRKVGERTRGTRCRVFFHDTHHRSVTAPKTMEALHLEHYSGVLAFGRSIADRYLDCGWSQRVWVWHEAADTRRFRPLRVDAHEGDLVWIGNWGDEERTSELHEFLIEPARELGLATKIFGVRYPPEALATLADAGIDYGGALANYRVPATFARYLMTVHVPRRAYADSLVGVPTIRMFEALACGIPLISALWEDSERLFRANVDYLSVGNGRQMRECMRAILADRTLAASLTRHGLETISARHTCKHRVEELFGILDELNGMRRELVGCSAAQA